MNRQGLSFLASFLVTAVTAGTLIYFGETLYALVVGLVGLLAHWALSKNGDRDAEVVDSSYFFGFLLTLVFLAVGVYRVAVAQGAGGTEEILGFLADLAAGLMLTIAGLLIRQIRTLAGGSPEQIDDARLLDVQKKLASNIETMAALWRERPEQQVVDLLQESRSLAHNAAEELDRSFLAARKNMVGSVERLDQATAEAAQSMTRAASGVGDSLTGIAERLAVDITHVVEEVRRATSQSLERIRAELDEALTAIQEQRMKAEEAVAQARAAGQQMAADAEAQHRQQIELWRMSLEQARTALTTAHAALDEEFRRSVAGFSASGQAFARLTEQTTTYVEALPNPAQRLAGLWDGVRKLEADLTAAIAGATETLGVLRQRSDELRQSLERLGGSADRAADLVESGSERLAGALGHELKQMNTIIEEYVALLEKTERSLKVRV